MGPLLSAGAHTKGKAAWSNPPKPPKIEIKEIGFVDIISELLHDLPFSRNQPLKSADDWYIRILKNKLIKLKKNKTGHCD